MDHAVASGSDFHDGADAGLDIHYLADIDFTFGDVAGDVVNDLARGHGGIQVGRGDEDAAILLDIHLHAEVALDLLHHFAAGADYVADLIGVDLDDHHARSGSSQFGTGFWQDFLDLLNDVQSGIARALEGFRQQFAGQAAALHVHLDAGDARAGAGHFEVHVAGTVFHALNVGKEHGAVLIAHHAHGDTRHRRLDRHARVHQRQRAAAGAGHRAGAVGFKHFRDEAQGVGEFLYARQDRQQRALSERAVADFAPAGAAHRAHLADAVGREVIVVHIPLLLFGRNGIEDLAFAHAAQGEDGERLRLPAREEAAAVHARQDAHFDGDRANLVRLAPIGAAAFVENQLAQRVFNHLPDVAANIQQPLGEAFDQFAFDFADQVGSCAFPRLLLGIDDGLADARRECLHRRHQFLVNFRFGHDHLLRVKEADQLVLQLDHLANARFTELYGSHHHVFRDLFCPGFHHDDAFAGAGDHQIQVARFHLLEGRVQDEFAVHPTHAHRAHRPLEGDTRDAQRGGGADGAEDVRLVFLIGREHGDDDLHFIAEMLGEERADGAVGHAGAQDGAFAGAAFALDEAARNFAGGIHALFKVYGEGEKINTLTGVVRHGGGCQDDGVAIADEHGTVGLLGHSARLDAEHLAVQGALY
ncbi:MAG: hypothetical protein BWY59_00481 [Verrucomicrobia bacterium ADurb.Bin345]|nr:MAG: hypothetical protein BWY59_00481 [Verrucomicrobia bacterium ADurb.Bin345]